MFPQLKKCNNESGIVLFTVLMVVIIIMIFSLGVLTESLNESNYAQQQIDQIASQELAKGIFWNAYSANMSASSIAGSSTFLEGRNYQQTIANAGSDNAYVSNFIINSSYDTFQ